MVKSAGRDRGAGRWPARRSTGCTPAWPTGCGSGAPRPRSGADIAAAILEEGHVGVDFTIVGSGPNGASPHHELSGRTVQAGDLVVVDIGGETATGYRSDCTRTYVVGGCAPAEVAEWYAVLQAGAGGGDRRGPAGRDRRGRRRGGPRG